MIKAVFFDFYNTLVRFWPPLDEIQQASCRELGLNVTKEGINRGYAAADIYFNRENERASLGLRTEKERLEFFTRYEQIILEHAGLPVTLDLARRVWEIAIAVPKDFAVFEDTIPALAQLRATGYKIGILSNLRRDMKPLAQRLGLAPYVDFCVTSAEVGAEKPAPPIFHAALARAEAQPAEAVHVGDQLRSDVVGARAVGIHPILLDRGDWQLGFTECVRVKSLLDVPSLLQNAPASLKTAPSLEQGPPLE